MGTDDEMAEWCGACRRWHQRRDRPVQCQAADGCRRLTDGYHGLCPEHRPADLSGAEAGSFLRSAGFGDLAGFLEAE